MFDNLTPRLSSPYPYTLNDNNYLPSNVGIIWHNNNNTTSKWVSLFFVENFSTSSNVEMSGVLFSKSQSR